MKLAQKEEIVFVNHVHFDENHALLRFERLLSRHSQALALQFTVSYLDGAKNYRTASSERIAASCVTPSTVHESIEMRHFQHHHTHNEMN